MADETRQEKPTGHQDRPWNRVKLTAFLNTLYTYMGLPGGNSRQAFLGRL